jgi:hypothetical protein
MNNEHCFLFSDVMFKKTLIEPQFIQFFFIPFNCKDLPSLNSKKLDNFIKKYDQLQLMVLDEISLTGKRILKFIDL